LASNISAPASSISISASFNFRHLHRSPRE
jgi:hypothetical protein